MDFDVQQQPTMANEKAKGVGRIVLTLLVIPVCYSLVYNWTDRKSQAGT